MRVLVLHGVDSFDDLPRLGLPMAHRVKNADLIISASTTGKSSIMKGASGSEDSVEFFDVSPDVLLLADCMKRVKEAWEERWRDDRRNRALGHVAAGFWLFYWRLWDEGEQMVMVIDLIRQGRFKEVVETVDDFIENGPGFKDEGADAAPA